MSLVESLLTAIVRLEGDALVMHVGEKPYVVTTSEAASAYRGPLAWGQVELSTRTLTVDAVAGMLVQLLPEDQRAILADVGAIEYALPEHPAVAGRFTVIAARGGDDIWLEIRHIRPEPVAPAVQAAEPEAAAARAEPPEATADETAETAPAGQATAAQGPAPAQEVGQSAGIEGAVPAEPPAATEQSVETQHPAANRPEALAATAETGPPERVGRAVEVGQRVDELLPAGAPEAERAAVVEAPPELVLEAPTEPILEAPPEPVQEPVPEPVMEAVPEPVEQPAPEPAVEAVPEPVREPVPEPVMETVLEPVEEPAPEPVMEAEPEPVEQPAPEPVMEVAPEPVGEPAPEPVAKAAPEAVAEAAPVPVGTAPEQGFDLSAEPVMIEVVEVEPAQEVGAVADDDPGVEIELESAEPVLASAPAPEVRSVMPDAPGRDEAECYDLSLDALGDEALELVVAPVAEQIAAAPVAAEGPPDPQVAASPEPDSEPTSEPGPAEAPPAQPSVDVAVTLEETPLPAQEPSRPAIVLPLTRPGVRGGGREDEGAAARRAALDRLLQVAAARGASNLYIATGTRPVVRVGGEIQILDAEEVLEAADVTAMLMEFAPAPSREVLLKGVATEWIVDVVDAGRVRCMSFRDHRGPGGIFRMVPARALSVEHQGLSHEIQALCQESEGLVLVSGPRSSGKSTLVSAFVDLINRTRADHVITFENQIAFVHENRRALVSQREARGDAAELRTAVRAALRENPDVLVIEDLRSPDVMAAALEAAASDRLVFGALPAASTVAAIERIMDQFVPERRAAMLSSLASTLRGVVSQVLLRKVGGGRVAAREILLNTPSVAALIAEGQTRQLLPELDDGRKVGMAPLNDALVSFVRSGAVAPAEAYRKAADREGLLLQLRRERIDTSFVERLA